MFRIFRGVYEYQQIQNPDTFVGVCNVIHYNSQSWKRLASDFVELREKYG